MAEFKKLFNQGINRDLDPIAKGELMPHAVDDALNMRFISTGGKNYSYKAMNGNIISFTVPDTLTIIGWAASVDKLVVFSTTGSFDSIGYIGQVTFNIDGTGNYTNLYINAGLKFGWNYPIRKAILIKESDTIERVYWTDYHNPPRCINIADPGVGGVDVGTLDFTPSVIDAHMEYKKTTADGSLKAGIYIYFYRLRTKEGVQTSWSFPSSPVQVADVIVDNSNENRTYSTYEGIDAAISAGVKAVTMTISGVDIKFDYLDMAYIYVTQDGVIGSAIQFYSELINGQTTIDVKHLGNENLGIVTIDDLTTNVVGLLLVGDIDVSKNMMFLGNISSTSELDGFDPSTAVVKPLQYLMPSDCWGYESDGSGSSVGSTPNQLYGHKAAYAVGISSGNIMIDGKYIVKGNTGTVIYNGVVYNIGDTFVGVSSGGSPIKTFTTTGDAFIKGCIIINKFNNQKKIIELEDDFFDFKGTASCHFLKSRWRGETYRVGFMPYDKFGNPMYVRWVCDIQMPYQHELAADYLSRTGRVLDFDPRICQDYFLGDGTKTSCSIRSLGFVVNSLDLSSIANDISGFSIVCAPRDAQILGQGIAYPIMYDGNGENKAHPMAVNKIGNDFNPRTGAEYLYHSPDYLFGYQPHELKNGDLLRVEHYYQSEGSDMGYLQTTNSPYEKMYQAVNGVVNLGANVKIKYLVNVSVNTNISGYNPDDPTRTYEALTHVGAGAFIGGVGVGANAKIVITQTDTLGDYTNDYSFHRPVCSYVRPKTNLYGGQSESAKANTEYMYVGHYQEINSTVYAQNGNSWVFNNIEVFGGDCFVNLFDFVRVVDANYNYGTPPLPYGPGYSHTIIFPCESNVNTALRYGRHINKSRTQKAAGINTDGVGLGISGSSGNDFPEEFKYEDAYSNNTAPFKFPALPVAFISNKQNGKMVRHSQQKFNGERINNFRRYLANDFIEVDSRGGDISNLVFVNDTLFYLQSQAVGYLPVHERQIISDAAGGQTSLGTGGVLERYDQMSNYYGIQHFFSLCKLTDGFVWFDMRRKSYMRLRMGAGVQEISTVKGLMNEFNSLSGDIVNNDNPFIGKGISSYYDPFNKEVVMVFNNNINGCSAWAYNILEDVFTGRYSEQPMMGISVAGFVILTTPVRPNMSNNKLYKVGAELTDVNDRLNYVCILEYTSGAPATEPGSDPTHWQLVNKKNEAYVAGLGDVCKFFGLVYDNYIEATISDGTELMKYLDNVELYGNDENGKENPFTDYVYSTSYQTASDLNLDVRLIKDYAFRDRKWCSNVPLSGRMRLIDSWHKIHLRKNNQNGNMFTSKNKSTKIVSLVVTVRYAK